MEDQGQIIANHCNMRPAGTPPFKKTEIRPNIMLKMPEGAITIPQWLIASDDYFEPSRHKSKVALSAVFIIPTITWNTTPIWPCEGCGRVPTFHPDGWFGKLAPI